MTTSLVRRCALTDATDYRNGHELTDAEAECLQDLLMSSDRYAALATACENVEEVANDDDLGEFDTVAILADDAATDLDDARKKVVFRNMKAAREIVALAEDMPSVPWGGLIGVYQAGYTTVEDLRAASQDDLIDDADMSPAGAARIKSDVGYPDED